MANIASTAVVFPLLCDCCGKEILGEVRDGKLVIFDKRHGQRHFVVIEVKSLLTFDTTPYNEDRGKE